MLYHTFQEWSLSRLGLGAMRLPKNEEGKIDRAPAKEMIEYAYRNGINYFDTAYRYHDGESEPFVGEVLRQFPRESFHLASKMPGHMMNYANGRLTMKGYLSGETIGSVEEVFEDQIRRCGVDYFDFYLLHNVSESSLGFYLDSGLDVLGYLLRQKEKGRIRRLGFSSHGGPDLIAEFLKQKGEHMEFAQIQLNYLDWTLQRAKEKYELLTAKGIPVIVMEPVRGGTLAALAEEGERRLKTERPGDSAAKWALRFVKSLPNVQVTLSGMTTLEQLKENIATFSEPGAMSEDEKSVLAEVAGPMQSLVPCTACRYCCEACPGGLEIPQLISIYNKAGLSGAAKIGKAAVSGIPPEKQPSACIACGACRPLCPQEIDIPEILGRLAAALA